MAASLVVPINLQALCVGVEDINGSSGNQYGTINFAQLAANFSGLPYLTNQSGSTVPVNPGPTISDAVLPPMFQTASPPLPSGIHLHWTLPDAIARAVSTKDGVTLRSAPNRWLVARVATNNANPDAPATAVNAWVVESDAFWNPATANDPLPTNRLSITRLLNPLPDMANVPNQPFQTVGRTFPSTTWTEPGQPGADPHTAFGYGDVAYASAYAMSPNVFGMYDTLGDLDLNLYPPVTTNVSYVVTGWYANSNDDPLVQLNIPSNSTPAKVVALIEQHFGWTFTPDPNQPVPSGTLCNGIVTGISWNPQTKYLKAPSTDQLQVAVGNTTPEALSALLAKLPALSGLSNVEGVLNALQLGLLGRLGQADGIMQIEEAQHQAQFGSSTAGTIWVIKPATPGNTNNGGNVVVTAQDLLNAASGERQLLPQAIGDSLNQLNDLQQQSDAIDFAIESYQSQIFADWFKYMLLEYSTVPPTTAVKASDIVQYVTQTTMPAFYNLVRVTKPAIADKIRALSEKINGQLGKQWLLDSVRSPRYWLPNDPVVLLSGPSLGALYREANPLSFDASGNLICRLTTQLISGMQITEPAGSVTNAQLPKLVMADASHAAELGALFAESFYVDPNQATVLAVAALGQGAGNVYQAVVAAQNALWGKTTPNSNISFSGSWPAPMGYAQWSSPWVPLLLEWEVNYYPWAPIDDEGSPASYAPGFVTSTFKLDEDSIDLVNAAPPPSPLPPLEVYQGFALLTHNTEINIVNQINTYLQNYPNDPYAAELKQIANSAGLPMMAQTLGGFTRGLLMRKQTLQLPVFDPIAPTQALFNFTNQTVQGAVGLSNTSAPLPLNLYNPVRAGFMQISKIWITDIFGQKIELTPKATDVIRASSMIPAGDNPASPLIGMAPRVAQPSRLLFRLRAADNDAVEMNSDPATTPIFGWVLFNHLDDNLMIYDAAGNPMGSLNVRGDLWTGAPGDNNTFRQPIATVFANANPHLRNFALGIYGNPKAVDFLKDLLATIDATVTVINPENSEQFQALSVLIGRPIALVRASLSLDLEGLPAIKQSWAEIANSISKSLSLEQRDSALFPDVQLPVRLGDLANMNDGLIGYFLDTGELTDYQTFYAPASTNTANGVVPPGPNQITVAAAAPPVVLSIMMDPRAAIHATTGIVPVKEIGIPPFMYSDAMKNMVVTFLTTPVLGSAATFAMPVPKENGYSWSWVSVDPASGKWNISAINPAATQSSGLSVQQAIEGWLRLSELPQ